MITSTKMRHIKEGEYTTRKKFLKETIAVSDLDSPYSATEVHNLVFMVDLTNGNVVFNLPEITTENVGSTVVIGIEANPSLNALTIVPFGTDVINGTIEIQDANSSVTLCADTGAWNLLVSATKVKYTGTAEINVGGVTEGQEFDNATVQEIIDSLIKQEKFPVLTAPSATFTSSVTGLREIGSLVSITFNSTFNRGSISPQYSATEPYRAGLPTMYNYTGPGLPPSEVTTALSDTQTITDYSVVSGVQTWIGAFVMYSAGPQPKSSYGNDYLTPLAEGMTPDGVERTITGVYPYFGSSSVITVATKQALALHNSTYFQVDMVAESGSDKQFARFSTSHSTITGIMFFNTVSQTWEWLSGSKANSLLAFTIADVIVDVNGSDVDYKQYTHNGSLSGARQLRFYTN